MTNFLRLGDYLEYMEDAAQRIAEYTSDLDKAGFLKNKLVQDAVIRNLEVIGEAANNIRKTAPEFVEAHPEIPWTHAIGARNALSHGYFRIDLDLVWKTVKNDVVDLALRVSALRTQLDLPQGP